MAKTIEDAVILIRDWTDARGCGAYRMLGHFADDAKRIAHYDETHGQPTSAALARKAARQYRLTSWVLRMVYEGREEHDRTVAAATEASEAARIAALPDRWACRNTIV